jgi:hypothetical protein
MPEGAMLATAAHVILSIGPQRVLRGEGNRDIFSNIILAVVGNIDAFFHIDLAYLLFRHDIELCKGKDKNLLVRK